MQPLIGPAANWSFGSSEQARGYLRAESFSIQADASQLRFIGVQLRRGEQGWSVCNEDPLLLELRVYAPGPFHPGSLLESRTVTALALPADLQFGSGWRAVEMFVELDPPLSVHDGWISVQGTTDPTCLLLWGAGSGGDGLSRLDRGRGWEVAPYDLNLCLEAAGCPEPASLQLQLTEFDVRLDWGPVPGAVDYRVEGATVLNGPWSSLGRTAGATHWTGLGSLTSDRRFFRVVAICP